MNAKSNIRHLVFPLAFAFATFTGPAWTNADVFTGFDTGLDGWTTTSGVSWQSTGGNPGGYLQFNDGGPATGGNLFAPSQFLGDWNIYNGGTVSFDYRVFSTQPPNFASFMLISGPGRTALRNSTTFNSPTEWINQSTRIVESEWQVTSGDWQAILNNVELFRISMANSSNAGEVTGVDNVRITSVPEPSSFLAIAGVFGISVSLRRRK